MQRVPSELEAQTLAWIAESSSSLRVLSLTTKTADRKNPHLDDDKILSPTSLIPRISGRLPSLRWLHLGEEACLPVDCEALGEETFPFLEVIELDVDEDTVDQLLDLSTTIRRVSITISSEDFDFSQSSTGVRTLKAFVKAHARLELVSIELGSKPTSKSLWAQQLAEVCEKRGVVFACNDAGAVDAEGAHPYKDEGTPSENDTDEAYSTDSEEEYDYDDEDDEMWSRLWSEEKRLAMNLG